MPEPDAGRDAGMDGGLDAGIDAGPLMCEDRHLVLLRRRAEVYFAVDSSGSMLETFEGTDAIDVMDSRWYVLRQSLAGALAIHGDDMSAGALFFPDILPEPEDDGCQLIPGLDVAVAPNNGAAIIAEFERRGFPVGGTPTAAALDTIRREIMRRGPSEVTQTVVLATDGAPNCNADPPIPPPRCFCTHPNPDVCMQRRPQNCLDDRAAIAAVTALADVGVPVYVIGLTDPVSAPILGRVLDDMAVAGGRARPEGSDQRYYDIRNAAELSDTLQQITDSVSRCTLYLDAGAEIRDDDVLRMGGRTIERDPTHTDGWDLTDPRRGEVTLYGAACEALADGAVLEACVF